MDVVARSLGLRCYAAAMLFAAIPLGHFAYGAQAGIKTDMAGVFSSYQALLSASVDDEQFEAPGNLAGLLGSAELLSESAYAAAQHVGGADSGELADALADFGAWISVSLEQGQFSTARTLIYEASDVCIACHTRLPNATTSPRAEEFVASDLLASLPGPQRARLQVATRRFSDALDTSEAVLASTPPDPHESYEQFELLVLYLQVAIAVTDNRPRARDFLASLMAGNGVDPGMRGDVQRWVVALDHSGNSQANESDLAAAQRLVDTGQSLNEAAEGYWPGLVHFMLAGTQAQMYIERADEDSSAADIAQAYYLLGVSKYETSTVDWLPQVDIYLERAIEAAPNTDLSWRTFQLLEAKVLGTLDLEVTPAISEHLQYLHGRARPLPP